MLIKLRVLAGSEKSVEIPVKGPQFFIGRDPSCNLRPRSDLISRRHCVLLVEGDSVLVRDFGSKNGTLINGQRVDGVQQLNAGDKLTVGPLKFEVHISRPAARNPDDSVHTDADIDSWLQDAEDNDPKLAIGDTHVMRNQESPLTDTTINKDAGQAKTPDAPESDPDPIGVPVRKKAAAVGSKTHKARRGGSGANSQDAAAKVLRQLERQLREQRENE